MSLELGMTHEDFLTAFARRVENRWSLTERFGPTGHDCALLDRTSQPGKALCRVYASRPSQCRTWPFWQRNLVSRDAWERAQSATPCPGMNTGTFFPASSIVERLLADRANDAGTTQ